MNMVLSSLISLLLTFFVFPAFAKKGADISNDNLCRAGLSTVFDVKPEDIKVSREQLNIVILQIIKTDKDIPARYKCAVLDKQGEMIWATETGAWRNTVIDSDLTYEVKQGRLTVREEHLNGSVFTKVFDIKKLKEGAPQD